MRMIEESEKDGLKLNIQKTKIMASSPITSWQIEGKKVKGITDFVFLNSKITANGDFSREIQTLTPLKKNYDQPKQLIKSRDITLLTKVRLVKVLVFPVVMYTCESWAIKKAKH